MRRLATAIAAVIATTTPWGCSLVVPSNVDPVHCSNEGAIGPPACGAGQVCAAGVCTACTKHEACGDGIDNDCNGAVDDGCVDGGGIQLGSPCCASASCTADAVCSYTGVSATAVCLNSTPGTLPTGSPCTSGADCRSHICIDVGLPQGACSDACCKDADCGNASFSCQQVVESGTLTLRCVPR